VIVDTSAVVAIVNDEEDGPRFRQHLEAAPRPRMSAASYLEATIVVDSARDPVLSRRVDEMLRETAVQIVDVTVGQATIAREAYRQFGKGSGHPAQLNFGDCFAYALAVETGEPLLYKGEDFTHAGVRSALDERPPGASS